MLYVALGDSITYGYSAVDMSNSYVNLLQEYLAHSGESVSVFSLCKPGWTSRQLLRAVQKVPRCIWQEAKTVTLLIGGNDLVNAFPFVLYRREVTVKKLVDSLCKNVKDILRIVREEFSGELILATLYNPFPESSIATELLNATNRMLRQVAKSFRGKIADIEKVFRGSETQFIEKFKHGSLVDFRLFRNPIHPTDEGHHAIAQSIMAARNYRQPPLSSRQSTLSKGQVTGMGRGGRGNNTSKARKVRSTVRSTKAPARPVQSKRRHESSRSVWKKRDSILRE